MNVKEEGEKKEEEKEIKEKGHKLGKKGKGGPGRSWGKDDHYQNTFYKILKELFF